MNYRRLTRFILPLAVTAIVVELGQQFLSAGMARVPQATQTLAAYGLAWGLVLLLTSPVGQTKELGLVLVNSPQSLAKIRAFVLLLALTMVAGMASLTFTPLGYLLIERLHGIDAELGAVVRVALLWLIPYPLLRGMALFHAGLLLRVRHTELVSYATLSNLGVSIVAVLALLHTSLIRAQPILLPVLAIYAGLSVEVIIVVWGAYRHRRQLYRDGERTPDAGPATLSFGYIAAFFWPLALIMLIQELSRPLINLFVARGPDPTSALATLAVVYTLGRIPYGWLNEIRSLASAFREEADSLHYIRRFAVACAFISFGMMLLLFWSPLRNVILERLIGLEPALASAARAPLMIFSLFSFIVTGRAYYHGLGLRTRRTRAMAPSAPARILAILAALLVLPLAGVYGATLGIAALTLGFLVETLVVRQGVKGGIERR